MTLKIAVPLTKNATESALTLLALAGSLAMKRAAANVFTLSAFDPWRC
jgi:hypothetical protein